MSSGLPFIWDLNLAYIMDCSVTNKRQYIANKHDINVNQKPAAPNLVSKLPHHDQLLKVPHHESLKYPHLSTSPHNPSPRYFPDQDVQTSPIKT